MDEASVEALISNLRDLSAERFVDSGFTTPALEATVTSKDGKRQEKVLISKSGTNYIAKRENDPELYELPATSVDELQKSARRNQGRCPGHEIGEVTSTSREDSRMLFSGASCGLIFQMHPARNG